MSAKYSGSMSSVKLSMGQIVIAVAEVSPTISSRVLFVQDGSLLFLQFVQTVLVVQMNIFGFLRILSFL